MTEKKDEKNCNNQVGNTGNTQKDEKFYGIQAFYDPEKAFYVMSDSWGYNCGTDQNELDILNDEAFEKKILERAIIMLGDYKLGKVKKDIFRKSLQVSGGEINDYLLDFNYLHYSKRTRKFYTSRMKFKDFLVYMWSERQWDIYRELADIHNFKKIVAKAKKIFKKYEHYIDEDGEVGMDYMLDDLYNNGTISY